MVVPKYLCKYLFLVGFVFILSCAHIPKTTQASADIYMSASENLKKQRLEEAKYEFNQLYTKHPKSDYADDALFRLGYISCVQEKYNDALDFYDDLIDKYPKSEWIFDAKVWQNLLKSWQSSNNELKAVRSKLNSKKTTKEPSENKASEEIEGLQQELSKLKEDNRKLRELIESME
ncbi:outer membrane protein assembly factor BamD [bacterium]|nr:outer membrane protein assembly factor BamD [bacterium]